MADCHTIGIDLGRSSSCCGSWINDKVEIIQNELGSNQTPSYVAFTEKACFVGQDALEQFHKNPTQTIFYFKDLIGRKFSDQSVQKILMELPYKVEAGINDTINIVVQHQGQIHKYVPEEIFSIFIKSLRQSAEIYFCKSVSHVVITVPSQFNDLQRQAIKESGTKMGLNILRIINESSAAAIAYNLNKTTKQKRDVLIFDFGCKKLEFTMLFIEDGIIETTANYINNQLGGYQFDKTIVEYFCSQILIKKGVDIRSNQKLLQKLFLKSEQAKKSLSYSHQTTIEITDFDSNDDLLCTITKAKFEMLCIDMMKNCILDLDNFLKDANIQKNQIDEIVLVGGSTKIPKLQELLSEYFDGKQLKKQINPEEVVAFGAAIQAAIFSGQIYSKIQFTCIFEVSILSIGVETSGGLIKTVIPRNTTIPSKKSQIFTTTHDYQREVLIKIYIGERCLAKDCFFIGLFKLTGITPALRGIPQIQITFEINSNQNLSIFAKDLNSKSFDIIYITNLESSLSASIIMNHIQEAQIFEVSDQIIKNLIEAKISLQFIIYFLKIQNNNSMSQMTDIQKSQFESACEETIELINRNPYISSFKFQNNVFSLSDLQNQLMNQLLMEDNEAQKVKAWFMRFTQFSLEQGQSNLQQLKE